MNEEVSKAKQTATDIMTGDAPEWKHVEQMAKVLLVLVSQMEREPYIIKTPELQATEQGEGKDV